ncbi:MAG: hypothetical protein JXB03_13150 [Spirochaetales bacterium]|nr:hypothetical protein [Spirochaetales bacterium]
MTVQEIDKRLEELREERQRVNGTPTEVYSRIVGYYRSLNNWNKGKREEYNYRQYYNSSYANTMQEAVPSEPLQGELTLSEEETHTRDIASYMFFYRQTCPNCPPMKEAIGSFDMQGTWVDVDTDEGYRLAEEYSIMAAPTVIFIDEHGKEVVRASQPKDLPQREALSPIR